MRGGIGNDTPGDLEGRVTTAEFDVAFVVNVYTPNSGAGLKRLDFRTEWDKTFAAYVHSLEKIKPVIVIGGWAGRSLRSPISACTALHRISWLESSRFITFEKLSCGYLPRGKTVSKLDNVALVSRFSLKQGGAGYDGGAQQLSDLNIHLLTNHRTPRIFFQSVLVISTP